MGMDGKGKSGEERLGDEQIHEPPEQDGTQDHDQKQGNKIPYLRFSFVSSNKSQNNADKSGVKQHG
jgi:hypothetical protein